jgi:DNA-binding NarL/FixJ family response regulator
MSRLYLVDDHAVMREGLRALLESAGHRVVGESDSPTPAVADIARLQPDVVLLDLNLNSRSGFEVLAELQRRKMGVKVVVLTMSHQPRHVAEAARMGAMGYALKGQSSEELLKAIAVVAGGQRYFGASGADASEQSAADADFTAGDALSPRERQILLMVARGASSTSIGEQLHLSSKTIDTYRSRLMTKLNLADVSAVVRWAIRNDLISVDEP